MTLSALVSLTLPLVQGCSGGTTPVHLDSLRVWYQVAGRPDSALAGAFSVAGFEGHGFTAIVPTDSAAAVWCYTTNAAGVSCKSNVATINATAGVPGGTRRNGALYDVQGRRADGKVPGVYFGRKARRVVR